MRAIAFTAVALSLMAGIAHCQVNQEMIARVAAGEITEAKASWWGFNEEDSTGALQAAIDSGAQKLIVEDMGKPWFARPLTLASNQEIVFEEGVELQAKRGEFHALNDALLRGRMVENVILRGYGATLRMWREDYDNEDLYAKASWRHCLILTGCSNVQVLGLTLRESGGDGIYLGAGSGGPCRDIVIRDVVCDANYRQGISVISAENLLIENTVLSNTKGTPPEAGIDFEPNNPNERLVNVVMRNCLSTGNNTSGYIVAVPGLNADSEPISVRFENCRSVDDGYFPASVTLGATLEGAVDGLIEFVGCSFDGAAGAGMLLCKPAERARVRIVDTQVLDCATERPGISPIMFASRLGADAPVGGVEFANVLVRDAIERPPLGYNDQAGGTPVRDVSGTLTVERNNQRTEVELTEELIAQWLPAAQMRDIPRLSIEGVALEPLAEALPPVAAEPSEWPRVRGIGNYVLLAEEGDEVKFTVRHLQVGRYSGSDMQISIIGPTGDEVYRTKAPFMQGTPISFTAPETGIYRFTLHASGNASQIADPSHPVALVIGEKPVGLTCSGGELIFHVPPGTEQFGVRVAGQGTGEAIKATLLNPEGEIVGQVDNQYQTHQFEVSGEQALAGGVWTLRLQGPSDLAWDDHSVDLRGIPPLLSAAGTVPLSPADG